MSKFRMDVRREEEEEERQFAKAACRWYDGGKGTAGVRCAFVPRGVSTVLEGLMASSGIGRYEPPPATRALAKSYARLCN